MRYFSRLLSAVGICTLLLFETSQAQTRDTADEATYVLVLEKSANVAAAIETTVGQMNFIKRPIARGRLKNTNVAYSKIRLSRSATQISLSFDDRAPLRMPANGSPINWTREDGEVFTVSARWEDSKLVQNYKAGDGERTNTFRFNLDESELALDVVITSGQLPVPLRYSLVYRRA